MKNKLIRKLVLAGAAFAAPGMIFAADATNPAWQFDIAPYLWAINLNGRVTTGPLATHVNQDFADLLRHLSIGGMLWLGAHKGPFGIFLNGVYAKLTDSGSRRRIDANATMYYGLYTAGASYIVLQRQWQRTDGATSQIQLEPYLGARYTMDKVRLTLNNFTINSNHSWTDPIVGLRIIYDVTARWVLQLSGDIGGTNASKQYSYNLAGLVGYKSVSKQLSHTTFYLGYRDLFQNYTTGSGIRYFNWNMHTFGPILGVNFSF